MGSETLSSACYLLSDELSIPFYSTSNGYQQNLLRPAILKIEQKRIIAQAEYFPTNLLYPLTLRVTAIITISEAF